MMGPAPPSTKLSVAAGNVPSMDSRAGGRGNDPRIAAALARLAVSRGTDAGVSGAGGRAVHPGLKSLFPGGLQPEVYTMAGAASVGLGLLVDGWCGVVGLPEMGVEAARDWGVELSRMVLVPDPGSWLETVAALIEGLDVVLAAAPVSIAPAAAQRLVARLRDRGATLVVQGDWPGAHARIQARTLAWQGLGHGYGALESQRLEVTLTRHHSRRSVILERGAGGVVEVPGDAGGERRG